MHTALTYSTSTNAPPPIWILLCYCNSDLDGAEVPHNPPPVSPTAASPGAYQRIYYGHHNQSMHWKRDYPFWMAMYIHTEATYEFESESCCSVSNMMGSVVLIEGLSIWAGHRCLKRKEGSVPQYRQRTAPSVPVPGRDRRYFNRCQSSSPSCSPQKKTQFILNIRLEQSLALN
jgi:hypothetical protein